jgi:hypothetical protein
MYCLTSGILSKRLYQYWLGNYAGMLGDTDKTDTVDMNVFWGAGFLGKCFAISSVCCYIMLVLSIFY